MKRQLLVWIWLPAQKDPVPMGVFEHQQTTSKEGLGVFTYLDSYLRRPDSVSVCPSFPLVENVFETDLNGGYFGFLLDAGPDAWGKQIVDRTVGPQDLFGYLRHSSFSFRTGAIAFSDQSSSIDKPDPILQSSSLNLLQQAAQNLESGLPIDDDMQRLLRTSTSIGGARPKAVVLHNDDVWIAKFMSTTDAKHLPPVPRLEFAMLNLAQAAGINVPEHDLMVIGGRPVLLSKRFDVLRHADGAFSHLRYASARTAQEDTEAMPSATGSYSLLARVTAKWAEHASKDQEQLFRRLIFNIATCNTDDHAMNHGFVDRTDLETADQLALSPAFDLTPILPTTDRVYQAMIVGDQGALSTYENAMSSAEAFGLSNSQAWRIAQEVTEIVHAQWRPSLQDASIEKNGQDLMARCFERLRPAQIPVLRHTTTSKG